MDDIKIKLDKNKIITYIPYLIILVSVFFGLYLVSPLFKPGVPINTDLAFHYSKILCFKETNQWSFPSAWCPYAVNGVPIYQNYSPLSSMIIYLLSFAFSLELSYKLFLVLVFFLAPIGAFLFFNHFKKPLAGSFAFAFILFEHGGWDLGGFEQIFLVQWPNSFGLGMFILSLYFTYRFFENPQKKNLAFVVIAASATMLAHVMHFIFLAITIPIIALFFWKNTKKHWKTIILLPILVFFITSFWTIPFLAKKEFFYEVGKSVWKADQSYIQYYSWGPLSKALVYIGLLGLLLAFWKRTKEGIFLGVMFLIAPALYIFSQILPKIYTSIFVFNYLYMNRLIGEERILIFMLAAYALTIVSQIKVGKKKYNLLILQLIVFILIVNSIFAITLQSSKAIVTDEQDIAKYQKNMKNFLTEDGGVLVEETLHYFPGVLGLTHSYNLWIDTKKRIYGGSPSYLYKGEAGLQDSAKGTLFGKDISTYNETELNRIIEKMNIKYIITYSPGFVDKFKYLPTGKYDPWYIFKTNITVNYFEINEGKIISETFDGFYGKATYESQKDTELTFKTSRYPNWVLYIDGVKQDFEKIDEAEFSLMKVSVPNGRHSIEFKYELIFVDYFSYFLSLIGVGLFLIVLLRKSK